jgi:FKBP-type peptidyl-prolyl cis-trans isomerase
VRRISFGLVVVTVALMGGCPTDLPFSNSNPSVTLSVDNPSISEDGGQAVVTATLNAATYRPVTVALSYSGTAVSGTNYVRSSTTITIPAFKTTGTVTIQGQMDHANGSDTTVIIDIASVTNGTEDGTQQVTVDVTQSSKDVPLTVTLTLPGTTPPVTEGTLQENGGTIDVTAELSAKATQPVTVNLGFSGTATQDLDYTRSGSSIVIPVGQTTGFITLTGVADVGYDNGETIVVDIASVSNATALQTNGKGPQVTVTIADEETAPTVTLAISPTTPIAENGGTATVTATLSTKVLVPVTVPFTFSGSAVKDTQYTASASEIVIPAGQTTGTLTVTAKDDGVYKGDQTIQLSAGTVKNATPSGTGTFTVTIHESLAAPSLTLEPKAFNVAEKGGTATLTVTLSAAIGIDTTVTLNFTGAAVQGTNYTVSDSQVTIPAGQTSGTVTLTGKDDSTFRGNLEIDVTLASPTGGVTIAGGAQEAIGFVIDAQSQPKVTLSLTGSPFAEAGGNAIVTATLSNLSGQAVTVNLGYTGTATQGTDYTASDTKITIAAGRLSGAVILSGAGSATPVGDKTIIVDVTTVTNGTEDGVQQVTAAVSDNLPMVSLSLTGSPLAEIGGTATVTATLSKTIADAVTVPFAFGGSAVKDTNYTANDTQIVIPAGQTTGTLTLTGKDDNKYTGNLSVVLTVQQLTNAAITGSNQVSATITDAQPQKNLAAGQAFLATNATAPGVVVLADGLQYKVITAGPDPSVKPSLTSTVKVNYIGTLIDGTVFDSGNGVSFGVNQVITGWTEALQLMSVGSRWMLYIPASLAYGVNGSLPKIEPNMVLIFDVTLISIQ